MLLVFGCAGGASDVPLDTAGCLGETAEVCDGLDNDCDGQTDEGKLSTFYADEDEDGFGDPDTAVDVCTRPDGYVANGHDCDDDNAQVRPDTWERCDGIDNNCVDGVDEPTAVDVETWFADVDGDGFGDALSAQEACQAPPDHVADNTDCDDDDPAVRPDAIEYCDGFDNDCDGRTDFDVSVPTDFATLQQAIDRSRAGESICVEPGVHAGPLDFGAKQVSLVSDGDPSGTVVDGQGAQLIQVDRGVVLLRGIGLTGGVDARGGVGRVAAGSLSLLECEIWASGCDGSEPCEGGLFWVDSADLTLHDVEIHDVSIESAASVSGGLAQVTSGNLVVQDVVFRDAQISAGEDLVGSVFHLSDGVAEIDRLEVRGVQAQAGGSVHGGLLSADHGADLWFSNLAFWQNDVRAGQDLVGDFHLEASRVVVGTNLIVAYNTHTITDPHGSNACWGVVYANDGESGHRVTNADVAYNDWTGCGAHYGLFYGGGVGVGVENFNVVGNTESSQAGGVVYANFGYYSGRSGGLSLDYMNAFENWTTGEEDYSAGTGSRDLEWFDGTIRADPLYVDAAGLDFRLGTRSPSIAAGRPSMEDADGTACDIGAFGGPDADWW